MAKNDQKRVEIFWGASHMINDNIFNIFSFFNFAFGYFRSPVFWPNLKKKAQKTERSQESTKEKKLKNKKC